MVQSWIRQALRASGVAILVPVAAIAAIALSVVGGGGGAGSLGQVLAGPAVPPAEAASGPAARQRGDEPPRTRLAAAVARAAPARRAPASGKGPRTGGRRPVMTLPARPKPRHPAPAPKAQPSAPAPAPASPPPRPHPVHDAGAQAAQTVRPLPVAGPAAADAVEAVVALVDPPL